MESKKGMFVLVEVATKRETFISGDASMLPGYVEYFQEEVHKAMTDIYKFLGITIETTPKEKEAKLMSLPDQKKLEFEQKHPILKYQLMNIDPRQTSIIEVDSLESWKTILKFEQPETVKPAPEPPKMEVKK